MNVSYLPGIKEAARRQQVNEYKQELKHDIIDDIFVNPDMVYEAMTEGVSVYYPDEIKGYFDHEKYKKQNEYDNEHYKMLGELARDMRDEDIGRIMGAQIREYLLVAAEAMADEQALNYNPEDQS